MRRPPEGREFKPTDPREVIRPTISYLASRQSRMDDPRHRRAGLPTCSGLVESPIKRFDRRVKGAEKSWDPTQAETILPTCPGGEADDPHHQGVSIRPRR